MTKGIVSISRDTCKGCELCISVCPRQVLAIDKAAFNKRGIFPCTVVNPDACIACCSCALMCPDGAITVEREIG